MARRKKGAVHKGRGAMCLICGLNCGKGGALWSHVEKTHAIKYDKYVYCFEGEARTVIADSWDDSVKTASGKTVVTHVLVRRFVRHPGSRGVPRAANKRK